LMTMPVNTVRLTVANPGQYTGSGVFTMAGSWNATAVALLPNGREWSKIFPVQVGGTTHSLAKASHAGS
jgi:hypothetical protein